MKSFRDESKFSVHTVVKLCKVCEVPSTFRNY